MTAFKPIKEGKVREIYDNGNSLIMVATDRISAFDVILKNKVTKKGTVLTQMSKFWFDYTKDLLPNHMLSVDVKDMPEFFRQPQFDGNSMLCRKLTMLPIECIVRGYITGSGWASYQKTGKVCGIQLPEGLQESQKLPEPIYTPSTKAEIGDHDENISYERSIEVLEKQFPGHGLEYATKLRDYTIALYKKCAEYALTRGIIIADTKFEFGLDEDGNVVLGDEMLTPDSSRFWPLEGYEPGHGQPSFDKQFVRDWLKAHPDSNYDLPQDVIDKTIAKYLEAYELPEPIYTPSTKAEIGDHDENISYERSIEVLEKQFPGHGLEYATKLRDYTIALYKKCAEYALTRGIIIADTKFEFGLDEDGNVVLGDEMLTPDSSRFWPLEGYEPGHGQPSFDKQFVRDWLKAHPDSNYDLPQDVIDKTIAKYLEAYELLTGKKL